MLFKRWSEPKVEMRRRDEPQVSTFDLLSLGDKWIIYNLLMRMKKKMWFILRQAQNKLVQIDE